MMQWDRLICDKRFGLEHYHDPKKSALRSDFRRDYDRLVFSSPFRRLQNKTQVFPLPGSIFVHNRLTHSMEVACVGKSIADRVADTLRERYAAGRGHTNSTPSATSPPPHASPTTSATRHSDTAAKKPSPHSSAKAPETASAKA